MPAHRVPYVKVGKDKHVCPVSSDGEWTLGEDLRFRDTLTFVNPLIVAMDVLQTKYEPVKIMRYVPQRVVKFREIY